MEYATNAKANTGVTLGAIGTGLGALSSLGGIGSMLMGGCNNRGGWGGYAPFATQHDLDRSDAFIHELQNRDILIASLNAEKVSDQHDIELYKQFRVDLNNALEPIRQDIRALEKRAAEQDVYNGVNTATICNLKEQIKVLQGLTVTKIPNASITPGWDDAT